MPLIVLTFSIGILQIGSVDVLAEAVFSALDLFLLPFGRPTEAFFFFGAMATFFEVFLGLDDLVFFFLEVVEVFPAIKLVCYYGFS